MSGWKNPFNSATSRADIWSLKRMTDTPEYTPPKIWTWNKDSGGRFANINRPIAGPDRKSVV